MTDAPYRILVVDDEPDVLRALKMTLERSPDLACEVTTAEDAEAALEAMGRERPDLVLADHRMPGRTGAELLAEVRERAPEVRRALITGYADLEIAMEAMEDADVHCYLQKPWDNEDLRLTVLEALETA